MMTRFCRAALVAAFVCSPLSAWAQDVTISTATGAVTLPKEPATIAVLDIAAIDTLAALGVQPQGVPNRLYVPYLAELADSAAPVGTLFEPDLEALASLAPDLIIAGGRSSTQVDALSQLAPTIDMTIWDDVVGEARERIATYGALFNKDDKAAELTTALDAKLAEVAQAVSGKGKALIVQTNGPKISAYGQSSRFGWIHTALGIPEAYESLNPDTHGDAVSFEFIAEANPDWIIVIDRASAVGEASLGNDTLANPLVAGTNAGQKGQIIYLSPTPIYIAGGGYTSLMTTMDELLAAFRT